MLPPWLKQVSNLMVWFMVQSLLLLCMVYLIIGFGAVPYFMVSNNCLIPYILILWFLLIYFLYPFFVVHINDYSTLNRLWMIIYWYEHLTDNTSFEWTTLRSQMTTFNFFNKFVLDAYTHFILIKASWW